MPEAPAAPPSDLFADLASRLADDEQRQLLRALLERLAECGGPAVLEEVRRRLRAILDDDP